jgi:hypothetical protein
VCQTGQWTNVGTGWTVQSSTGAGYSTSFHIASSPSDPNNLNPAAFQELFEIILEGYSQVKANGVNEDDSEDAMNSIFVGALWACFPTIKGYSDNFMYATP